MRRRTVLMLTFACLALLGVGMAPWTLASDYAAARIGKHIKALTGLDLDVGGRTTLALLPAPRIKMEDVALRAADGAVRLKAAQFRGEVRLLPLLRGEMELSDATLFEPILNLGQTDAPFDAWESWVRRAAVTAQIGSGSSHPHVTRLVIVGGSIELERGVDRVNALREINVVATWPEPRAGISVAGRVTYADRPIEVVATGLNPLQLADGSSSDFTLRLKAEKALLAGKGTLSDGGRLFDGQITCVSESLSDLERWIGTGVTFARFAESFSASGPATVSARGLSLSSASVTVGDDTLEGVLSARFDRGRVALSGTLATEDLDLSSFARPLAPRVDGDGTWARDPFDRAMLALWDVDLRISATSARVGRFAMADLASSIMLKNGRFEVTLGRATAYRGLLKGRLLLQPSDSGVDARLQALLERADLGAALSDVVDTRRLNGSGSMHVAAEASGNSVQELARSLNGRASLTIRQGEVVGINFAELLRRVERRPLSAASEWRGGRTTFEQAGANVSFSGGVAELQDAVIAGPNVKATLEGRLSIAERTLAMNGLVTRNGTPAPRNVATELPFEVVGSWDDPRVGPDVKALIRRSGAAAPLLAPASELLHSR